MIMSLSLLVYSIAQRRIRASMEKANKTSPNQINVPTATSTLRWVFQCFKGINLVQTEETYDKTNIYLDGLDKLRTKIINLVGGHSLYLYHIQKSSVRV
jgi:transposase